MRTGEATVGLLAKYGVECVFGIPGTHTLELYRGLAGKDAGVRHILAHHEQGAGFMADGYARTTGKPGVCFVITGAGVTNIATPMAEAYSDSIPMLIISPVNPPDGGAHNQGRLHEITDQAAVTKPFTAFSATAQSVAEIPRLIARAFGVFASERPCPVHISIPLPMLVAEIHRPWQRTQLPAMPVVGQAVLEQAIARIEDSRSPVIIAGGGTRFCAAQVIEFAETMGCPVVTTVAGRGVIPASHPLCSGAQLRAAPVQELVAASDLGLMLGTELAQTDHYNDALALPDKQIRINISGPSLIGDADILPIKADVRDALTKMSSALKTRGYKARTDEAVARCEKLRAPLRSAMTEKEQRHWQVLQTVRECAPGNVPIFSDMTQLAYTAADFMPLARPNTWHHPTGYGTLGYALPAAIGGAIAQPEQCTLVIVGDAGLQYTMQELPLVVELGLNIKILLWNNDRLEQINDDMQAAGIPPTGVTQRNPDFKLLAEACGWRHVTVDSLVQLRTQLKTVLDDDAPCILQINEHKIFG